MTMCVIVAILVRAVIFPVTVVTLVRSAIPLVIIATPVSLVILLVILPATLFANRAIVGVTK